MVVIVEFLADSEECISLIQNRFRREINLNLSNLSNVVSEMYNDFNASWGMDKRMITSFEKTIKNEIERHCTVHEIKLIEFNLCDVLYGYQ